MSNSNDRILKVSEVSEILGRSPKTIWRWWAKVKVMPEPIKIMGRAVGWKESTINDWLDSLDENKQAD